MSRMNITQVSSQVQCQCCNAVLPMLAVFCGQCGMRVDKDTTYGGDMPLSGQRDIGARYRVTSLIRRRPAIQLSFAWDTRLQRLTMLRDIDVSGLDETAKQLAYTGLQQEYDLLRRQDIPDVMPLIASHYYGNHLYSVTGWPSSRSVGKAIIRPRPYTLHDLLQSGIGLPNERIATSWIAELGQAVECLHEHQIILGELDPNTIILNSQDYSGQPALMVSWLPTAVRHALSQKSPTVLPSSFRAPETLYGQEDGLTDVYSLGALLYLLLTGTAPDSRGSSNPKRDQLRSPRAINSHISRSLDAIVMQALAVEPDKRFQHASELGEALLNLNKKKPIIFVPRPRISFARPPKSTPKLVAETPVSSDMDNNGNKASNDETIEIENIQGQLARSYWSRINTGSLSPQERSIGEADVDAVQVKEEKTEEHAVSTSKALVLQSTAHSDMLPAALSARSKKRALVRVKNLFSSLSAHQNASFLRRVQRFVLGEQKHSTLAAALIEMPMRIQPTQSYAMRIQIVGRDQPKDQTRTGGLTSLRCGDVVHIEVRLALYQNAYVIQQADVAIPAGGYAAEVTIPMHPPSSGPTSRRERLHIFFMDKERNPLYEKPFVIELFVSPLVQLSHEGHNVLSIPL
jgi:serine/threonine protein kinase